MKIVTIRTPRCLSSLVRKIVRIRDNKKRR